MGKNILIIGASGAIGSAITEQLILDGHQLILHYHQNRDAIDTILENAKAESILGFIKADLSNMANISDFLEKIAYPVDAIIFASGIAYYGLFQETPDEVMEEMFSIHIGAPLLITKTLLGDMLLRKNGKIIFISSIWGEVGASNEVLYSTVKGAQNSFVKALAKEVGPSGILVNAVSPGFIDTKMNPLSADEKEALLEEIPLNRPGLPEDVANTVSFLLSDKSNYIHGEIIRVTGGWH
ncbi:elongation factor P 5-aminopentanone reductase [Ornithinibacillus bavariensis]|uniref:elongation factor P 5-aminopentanone reductase n=1 Tax=Ornithinibacillus bavariensis TaxID=545502 RepID=UPI000ED3AD7F|nr:3-ketoacyl-ACP reductase [Ornithinibacillus sp.]